MNKVKIHVEEYEEDLAIGFGGPKEGLVLAIELLLTEMKNSGIPVQIAVLKFLLTCDDK